jgi:hypothetical protein
MPGMTGGGGRTGGVTPYWADAYLIDVGRGHPAGVNKVRVRPIWCKGGGRSERGVKVRVGPIG